jgi:hypothetical protein
LNASPDPQAAVLFPIAGDGDAELVEIECFPTDPGSTRGLVVCPEAPELEAAMGRALAAARADEFRRGAGLQPIVVTLTWAGAAGGGKLLGASFALALALADKRARLGGDNPAGRVFATGALARGVDHRAEVRPVDGFERKLRAVLAAVRPGDAVAAPSANLASGGEAARLWAEIGRHGATCRAVARLDEIEDLWAPRAGLRAIGPAGSRTYKLAPAAAPTRDDNERVLDAMVTREGTMRQAGVGEIARAAGLADLQARDTLSKLGGDGLVRDLDGDRWEVRHGFRAGPLGRVLGRSRARLLRRLALAVAGAALIGGATVLAAGLLYWPEVRADRARQAVQVAGFSWVPCAVAGTGTCLKALHEVTEEALSTLAGNAAWLNVTELDLARTPVASLEPLASLTALTRLDLTDTSVTSLEPLAGLTGLTHLELAGTPVASLEPLAGLTGLTHLNLWGTPVASLEPLASLTGLTELDLVGTRVTSLEPLAGLTGLPGLDLTGTPVASLEPLASLTALTWLDLVGTRVTSLEPLAGLTGLTELNLTDTPVASLEPLAGLRSLTHLNLWGTRVASLKPLAGLTALTWLDLTGTQVTSLEPLAGLTGLTWLNLTDTPVASLAPLGRLDPGVILGASDELMATLPDEP